MKLTNNTKAVKSWTTLTAVSLALGAIGQTAQAQSQASSMANTQASGQASTQAEKQSASQAQTNNATQSSGKPTTQAGSQSSTQAGRQSVTNAVPAKGTTTGSGATGGTTNSPKSASASTTVDLVALAGPTQVVHNGKKWTTSPSIVSLKKGQEVLPLTMTFTNGNEGRNKMTGIRVLINGRKLLSDADFRGRDSASVKMDDILPAGDTQLEIQSFGPDGSTLTWVVTTPKIKVSDIKPDTVGPGDKVTIGGKNLPKSVSAYQVKVGETMAAVVSANEKQVVFTVPKGVASGKQTVTLYIAGVKCDPLSIKIKGAPELTSTNMVTCPPSTPITISGTGFSTKDGDTSVTFNGMAATVNKVTATSIECIVPNLEFPQDGVEVKVKSGGADSKNTLKVDLSIRTIPRGESLGPGGAGY